MLSLHPKIRSILLMRKLVPNIITLMNLLCGMIAVTEVLYFKNAAVGAAFIVLGAVFDFFDGMTARLLKVSSPIGKELDSLSDVVTFGVAPAVMAMSLILNAQDNILAAIPLVMALFSSYRLAKFNLDERQTDSFIGLATPANAFFWLSIPLIGLQDKFSAIYNVMSSAYFIIPVSLVMSCLLVSEIPMFSLKFHNLKWADNKIRFIFLILSAVLSALLQFAAIPVIIVLYIVLSIVNNIINRKGK